MARLHDHYKQSVVPQLMERFAYSSIMQVPRIEKITLNMGVGEAINDKKIMDNAVKDLTQIAGSSPGSYGEMIYWNGGSWQLTATSSWDDDLQPLDPYLTDIWNGERFS